MQTNKKTPLLVGYSFTGEGQVPFFEIVRKYRYAIGEVYFSFPGIAGGRSPLGAVRGYTDFEVLEMLTADLLKIKETGVKLDLLFNALCNGNDALSLSHEREVVSVLDYLYRKDISPEIVTTASPVTAEIVHRYDKSIDVRASVNMRISTIKGIQYLEHLFDSFCIFRDVNRDIESLTRVSRYLRENGKGITIIANSGCLRSCSMQTFHDNAVAHEKGIMTKDNLSWAGVSGCRNYLKFPKNFAAFLQNTWIRPEDIHNYDGLVDGIKLATRMHALPAMVIDAYARESYQGNLADLFEPGHGPTFAPYVIDNDRFPSDWFEKTTACNKRCEECGYCEHVRTRVFVNSEEM